jgi:hypothetical protein
MRKREEGRRQREEERGKRSGGGKESTYGATSMVVDSSSPFDSLKLRPYSKKMEAKLRNSSVD